MFDLPVGQLGLAGGTQVLPVPGGAGALISVAHTCKYTCKYTYKCDKYTYKCIKYSKYSPNTYVILISMIYFAGGTQVLPVGLKFCRWDSSFAGGTQVLPEWSR